LNRGSFEQRVLPGDRVLIDTSVLIAYFDQEDQTNAVAALLIDDFVRTGRNAAVVSPVTAMEVLVRPLRAAPGDVLHVHDFLRNWPNFALVSIDSHVAQEAATIRATHKLAVPDALIVATGIVAQIGHLVTNDKQRRRRLAPINERVAITELYDYV
jgi:predicted nucleic acid-binding protein